MSRTSKFAFFVLAIIVGYTFVYPAFGQISALSAEKQKYDDALNTVSNIENKKDELVTAFNGISEQDRHSMDTVLPDNFNFVRLVSQVDAVASKYAISISHVTAKEQNNTAVGDSIAESQPEKKYNSGIIGFSFGTTYENFKKFMDDLEKSLRIMDVRSVKIDGGEKGVYLFTVEVETYWLR